MKKLLLTILALTIFLPHYAHASIALVNRAERWLNGYSGASDTTTAFNLAAGNLVYFWSNIQHASGQPCATITSITDTAGNTYTQIGSAFDIGNNSLNCLYQWYAKNTIANASDVLTINYSNANGSYFTMVTYQFSGVDTVNPLVTSGTGSIGNVGATVSTPTLTLTGSSVIVAGTEMDGQPITAGSGYTLTRVTDGFGGYTADEYQFTSTSQTASAVQFTGGGGAAGIVAAVFQAPPISTFIPRIIIMGRMIIRGFLKI